MSISDDTSKIIVVKNNGSLNSHGEDATLTHIYAPQQSTNRVVFLGLVLNSTASSKDSLVAVHEDGQIDCFDGDELKLLWTAPASALGRDTTTHTPVSSIVYCQLTDVNSAKKGLLKSRPDVLASFPGDFGVGANPADILLIISQPKEASLAEARTLHIVTFPQVIEASNGLRSRSTQFLMSIQIPWLHKKAPKDLGHIQYDTHVSSGLLYELAGGTLSTFDLTNSTPKIQSQISGDSLKSFLRLSSSSVIAASAKNVGVYNTTFKSLQASIQLGLLSAKSDRKRKSEEERGDSLEFKLVAYSPKLNIVHAIRGNELIALQIELRNESKRPRPMGLLIDSLGRGIRKNDTANQKDQARLGAVKILDEFAAAQDIEAFERLLSQNVKMDRDDTDLLLWKRLHDNKVQTDGLKSVEDVESLDVKPIPKWIWPDNYGTKYPKFDAFWTRYALRKIFSWTKKQTTTQAEGDIPGEEYCLLVEFFPYNVVEWLIRTGNLTTANIASALREDLLLSQIQSIPADQIMQALVELDPTMELLYLLLSNTYLNASELVHTMRLLMDSLELFGDSKPQKQALVENGDVYMGNGNVDAEIAEETEAANDDLQVAEFHLGDESNIRVQALSVALAKLHSLPTSAVVQALRNLLRSSEIVSLIHLLRFELAQGSWTSRYLDVAQEDQDLKVQDYNIVLVSDMLNCCVDAIGSGGWLSGDAMLVNGDHFESEELIASLKLEVSAALEGIEEVTYLKGLLAEMIRYGGAVQASMPVERKRKLASISGENVKPRKERPITLSHGKDSAVLPLGLKAEQKISLQKVGAGGEIEKRSTRDIGRLKSKKVGQYSLERIVI